MAESPPDRRIAERYRLLSPLGHGGMGVVWLAEDLTLQRRVAVKELRIPPGVSEAEQATMRARVSREARAAARLNHPNVTTVYDVVNDDGHSWIVMEYVDAPTLTDIVLRDGPLPPARAAAVGLGVLGALEVAHREGIVHRDVKPSNVMVSDSGRVKLADFGVAVLSGDPKITMTGLIVGSPSYMSPEQAREGGSGPATDLWGLGATLYFAVEGAPPFERGQALATLNAVAHDEPRPLTRAGDLAPVLHDLLVKDPEARPAAPELRARLRRVIEAGDRPAATVALPPPPAPRSVSSPPAAPQSATPPPAATAPRDTEPEQPWIPPAESPPRRAPAALVLAGVVAVIALTGFLFARALRGPDPAPGLVAGGPSEAAAPTDPPATAPAPTEDADPEPTSAEPTQPAPTEPVDEPEPTEPVDDPDPTEQPTGADAAADEDDGVSVPADWEPFAFGPPGASIAIPPGWQVRDRDGTRTDLVDPETGTYLRLDYTDQPKPDPVADWQSQSQSFGARKSDYAELRIEPVDYRDYDAALWEYTYSEGGADLHAYNLGLVAGDYGYALNFQTRESNWQDSQELFEQFKRAFDPAT